MSTPAITYFFGAGASYNALPTINRINDKLEEFRKVVDSLQRSRNERGKKVLTADQNNVRLNLHEDILWLQVNMKQFASVDTLAKYLFLTGNDTDLLRVKVLMSLWFNFLEMGKHLDRRYNSFFANILKTKWNELPPSIKIVSWNYDFQFEYAYSMFSKKSGVENARLLNIVDRYNTSIANEGFTIFKVNGSASFCQEDNEQEDALPAMEFALPDSDLQADLLHKYNHLSSLYKKPSSLTNPPKSRLSYAWETDGKNIPEIRQAIGNTTILAVVGYSFPFFNRDIDKALLSGLEIARVYIQDPTPEPTIERLLIICPELKEKIEVKKDVEQFVLPNELN